jgi:hypothetical protein
MLTALFLSAIIAIPFSTLLADDTQNSAPTTQPSNPNAATQPSDMQLDIHGWTKDTTDCAERMRQLSMAIMQYTSIHNRLPASLGSVIGQFPTSHDAALCCLTPGDERRLTIPDHPSADWVNQNTSFIYLAETVMFHTRLDQPFQNANGDRIVILTFIDCHTELSTVANATQMIETSKKTLANTQ